MNHIAQRERELLRTLARLLHCARSLSTLTGSSRQLNETSIERNRIKLDCGFEHNENERPTGSPFVFVFLVAAVRAVSSAA